MTTLYSIAAIALLLGLWFVRWSKHAKRFKESGYVPAPTGLVGKFIFGRASWLLTTLAVGSVKVTKTAKLPKMDHVIWAANHQFPSDFAMLRRGAGRHFRMLTDSAQLGGVFGVLAAFMGVISVRFKEKTDGKAAQAACVNVVAEKRSTLNKVLVGAVTLAFAGLFYLNCTTIGAGTSYGVLGGLILLNTLLVPAGLIIMSSLLWGVGRGASLGIFPQGALIPENVLKPTEFRPGAVRIAREAAAKSGETVYIVPIAIHYNRDAHTAGFLSKLSAKHRLAPFIFNGLRNPRAWEPCFKVKLENVPEADRPEIERQRAEVMEAYNKSKVMLYGGSVVVGAAIDVSTLPADDLEAIEVIRLKIEDLAKIAANSAATF
mgnify:CR=1 FL=1